MRSLCLNPTRIGLLLSLSLLFLFSTGTRAALSERLANTPIKLTSETQKITLGPHLYFFNDKSNLLGIEQILNTDIPWKKSQQHSVSKGIDESSWWFRFDAKNHAPYELRLLLEIAYASLDHVDLFLVQDNRLVYQQKMGDKLPFEQRPIKHHFLITPVQWPALKTQSIYIRVQTNGVVQFPATLWSQRAFDDHDQARQLLSGMYFGIMLVMLLYNMLVYAGLRDTSYLYYCGFVLAVPLFVAAITGYAYQYLWPNSPHWNGQSIGFFLSTMILFAMLFINRFLFHKNSLRPSFIKKGKVGLFGLIIIMFGSVFFAHYNTMLVTVIGGAVFSCGAALLFGVYGLYKKLPLARIYTVAWSSLFVGGIILAGNKFNLLPQNVFTENAVQIGSSLLVTLLSLAMAERINRERAQRYNAQQQSLMSQIEANQKLEQKVRERTEELEKANSELLEISSRDSLTGLHNRRHFDQLIQQEFTRCFRHRRPIAVILMDIDHFKQFNDTYGHLIGDDCLRTVSSALQECISRPGDTLFRYGGEEFCVLLPETDLSGALAVAERARSTIEEMTFLVDEKQVPVTISLGVNAVVPDSAEHYQKLVKDADERLYQAKENGRNQVQPNRK